MQEEIAEYQRAMREVRVECPLKADDTPEHAVKMLIARMFAVERYVTDIDAAIGRIPGMLDDFADRLDDLEKRIGKIGSEDELERLDDKIAEVQSAAEDASAEAYAARDDIRDLRTDLDKLADIKDDLWRIECALSRAQIL